MGREGWGERDGAGGVGGGLDKNVKKKNSRSSQAKKYNLHAVKLQKQCMDKQKKTAED